MSIVYKLGSGFSGLSQLESEKNYSTVTGETRIDRHKGKLADVKAKYEAYKALGYDVGYTPTDNDAFGILSIAFAGESSVDAETPISEQWELKRNLIEKDIWQRPEVIAEIDKFTDREKKAFFRADIEALLNGERFYTDDDGEQQRLYYSDLMVIAQTFGCDTSVFDSLFDALCKGVTQFQVIQRVLHRTRITANTQTLKAADVDTNKMLPNQLLVSAINGAKNTTHIKFEMPSSGYWLKLIPEVIPISKTRWKITNEYWHVDSYEAFNYPGSPGTTV